MSAIVEHIKKHPVQAEAEAQRMMEEHALLMVESARLLGEPLSRVSLEDKRRLIVEMRTALLGATACVNIQALAEIEGKKQARQLKELWGWML